jgi:hypothetical protein
MPCKGFVNLLNKLRDIRFRSSPAGVFFNRYANFKPGQSKFLIFSHSFLLRLPVQIFLCRYGFSSSFYYGDGLINRAPLYNQKIILKFFYRCMDFRHHIGSVVEYGSIPLCTSQSFITFMLMSKKF